MGLGSSQVRFALLTARQNAVEGRLTQISNEKLSLARRSSNASKEYSNAMNATKLVWESGEGSEASDISYGMFNHEESPFYLKNNAGLVVVSQTDAAAWGIQNGYLSGTRESFVSKATGLDQSVVANYIAGVDAGTKTTTDTTSGVEFTTSYTDDEVFQCTASNYNITVGNAHVGNGAGISESSSLSPDADQSNLICFYKSVKDDGDSEFGAAWQSLSPIVTQVCASTGKALTDVLSAKFGDKWSSVSPQIVIAIEKATAATYAWYEAQMSDANNVVEVDEALGAASTINKANNNSAKGSISVFCEARVKDEYYVDVTAMQQFFLANFDQYCQAYDGNAATTTNTKDNAATKTEDTVANWSKEDGIQEAAAKNESLADAEDYDSSTNIDAELHYWRLRSNFYKGTAGIQNYSGSNAQGTGSSCDLVGQDTQVDVDGDGLTSGDSAKVNYYLNLWNEMYPGKFVVNNNVEDADYLEQQLIYGTMYIEEAATDSAVAVGSASSPIKSVSDDEAIEKAKAKYESEKDEIDYKESILDVESTNLDAERSALSTEKESVQKIIDYNIKKFKLFENA